MFFRPIGNQNTQHRFTKDGPRPLRRAAFYVAFIIARSQRGASPFQVYRTYGRYIPKLSRQDGSAFERHYRQHMAKKGGDEI